MLVIYGIKNCDKCRAGLRWLKEHNVPHQFHDVRADGLDAARVQNWFGRATADVLLNKRSKTWRTLSATEREQAGTADGIDVLLAHPTLFKRPLVDTGAELLVGYDASVWQDRLVSNG